MAAFGIPMVLSGDWDRYESHCLLFQLLALIAHTTIWETRNCACLQRQCVIDNPFISRDRWTCCSLRLFLFSHYWLQISCLIPQPSRGDGTTSILCLYARTYQMASLLTEKSHLWTCFWNFNSFRKKIPQTAAWLMASEDCGSCVSGTQIAIKLIAQEAALKMGLNTWLTFCGGMTWTLRVLSYFLLNRSKVVQTAEAALPLTRHLSCSLAVPIPLPGSLIICQSTERHCSQLDTRKTDTITPAARCVGGYGWKRPFGLETKHHSFP